MMRVFPSQPRLAAGFRFQLAKHNHMVVLCIYPVIYAILGTYHATNYSRRNTSL